MRSRSSPNAGRSSPHPEPVEGRAKSLGNLEGMPGTKPVEYKLRARFPARIIRNEFVVNNADDMAWR